MSEGLIVAGRRFAVPGVRVTTWLDDPTLCPLVTKGEPRLASAVTAVGCHTSRGRRGVIRESTRRSNKAAALCRYQVRTKRQVSWHITIGAAGQVYQQADAATWLCWHASHANGFSVGIEVAQDSDTPDLTVAQVAAFVGVVTTLCEALGIPKRIPVDAQGRPMAKRVKAWQPRKQGGAQKHVSGVMGHRNLTTSRGPGDPGDPLMLALLAAGFTGASPEAMTLAATNAPAPPVAPAAADVEEIPDEQHDEDGRTWPPLPSWIDPALEIDASDDLPDDPATFVREALPYLAALGVTGDRALEVIAHCATECDWGRRAIGDNRGGVKIKLLDNAEALAKYGRGLAWWRDEGHVASGDATVVYYRGFDDDAAFWAFFVKRYAPLGAPTAERYAAAGAAFWGSDPGQWFAEILRAGYRGPVRQLEVERLVAAHKDTASHPSVAEHRRVVERVRGLAATPR